MGLPKLTRAESCQAISSKQLFFFPAKRGIDIPTRLMFGCHTSKFVMGVTYSRDGAAASLLVLEKLIKEIATGRFEPDHTRSGRIHVVEHD